MTPRMIALMQLEFALNGMWLATGVERTILRAVVRHRLDRYRVELALSSGEWLRAQADHAERNLMRHGVRWLEARA